jgi:acyl carrier protein
MTDDVKEELLDIIQRESLIARSSLCPEAKIEGLGIASIDVVSIIFAIEERYGVELSGEEFSTATTFGGLLDDLAAKIRGAER